MSDPMLDSIMSRSDWSEPDSVLGTYVAQTDRLIKPQDGVPLTLTVHGLLVSGDLIPQWQWFAEVSEMDDYEDAFYTGMAEHMKEQSDLAHDAIRARDTGAEVSHRQMAALLAPTKYIHLRKARIYSPDSKPGEGRLWRGRLCDVSGWTPGVSSD
ncbi:hypothetical protein [Actinoplanes sp. NPDC026619]|uniref:hypothetical protein n=1 Tax=Actinoplanes sp. NPDC026619 TaxID=3155798 RepID=UPI0033EAC868